MLVSSGAGTVMTTLAETLSNNGFDVTLLYTRGDYSETADIDFWVQYYLSRGIRLAGGDTLHPLLYRFRV
jgi:Trk K+ transport system NAD-binding subunit